MTTATENPAAWRRRAITTAVWSGLVALALIAAACAIAWSWRRELPHPIATHWGAGSIPDGFSSLGGFLTTISLTGLGCAVMFSVIALLAGQAAGTLRIVAGANVWMGGMLAIMTIGSLASQRRLADAHQAPDLGWTLAVALVAPVVPSIIAAFLVPKDRPQPATAEIPLGAPQVPLGESARAVWLRRTSGGPGVAIAIGSILLMVVLSITLRTPALLALAAVLILLFAAMFSFQVRVDNDGITVRSALGWPRTHIAAGEIERAGVIGVSPFLDFGGWGWRVSRRGRTGIVLRSGEGLLVEQTGGRSLVVTVNDAAQGAALLNTMAARAREHAQL